MTAPRVRGMERQATCTSGQHDVRLCRVSRPAQSSKRAVAAAGSHRLAITASRSHARDAAAATCARIGSKRPAWSQPCSAGSTSALTRCAAGSFSISASHLAAAGARLPQESASQRRARGKRGAAARGWDRGRSPPRSARRRRRKGRRRAPRARQPAWPLPSAWRRVPARRSARRPCSRSPGWRSPPGRTSLATRCTGRGSS